MPPLTEEQLQELLNQRFGQPQGIARLNPLAFQFENAFTPYSSEQMDALKTMRLPDTKFLQFKGDAGDPAFFSSNLRGYDFDPYKGTKEDFNYLYGIRPAFQYDTEFVEPAVKSGIETVDKVQGFVEDNDLEAAAIPKFKEGELKQPGGIANFLRTILGFAIPGANLFMGDRSALEGIKSLNQRLRNTDFGRSKTLQEYFQRREARKEAERLAPIQKQLQEAADRGGGYQPTTRSQNVARTASRVSDGKTRAYGL